MAAKRPVFVPIDEPNRFVQEHEFFFDWHPGFAPSQKKKNIAALHEAARSHGIGPLLEVSTKSDEELGVSLSAFNLQIELGNGVQAALESVFQGSKVFEEGGPFTDIYRMPSRDARRDTRLRSGGAIRGFEFLGIRFDSEPKTAFYDWLYVRALAKQRERLTDLRQYAGFTDIEFNPAKSTNCQARSCALFVSLWKQDRVDEAIASPEEWLDVVRMDSFAQPYSDDVRQPPLL